MATPIVNIQTNPSIEIALIQAPTASESDLIYTLGGGSILPNLKDDLVNGGKWYHGGNPLIDTSYQTKDCSSMSVVSTDVHTTSGAISRGLIYVDTINNKYYWDEVYTTPLGVYLEVSSTPDPNNYELKIDSSPGIEGNQLLVTVKDINILPKTGDYIIVQKIKDSISFTNDTYTDDIHSLPVFTNNELYQFKITQVLIESGSGDAVLYRLILDKSIALITGGKYCLVLLNRENTGIQKELFYDTFEQIEVQKQQLLGDPYNNTSNTALPLGRKNYLNYSSVGYLGMSNYLNNIITPGKTPFIIFDLNDDIKDRILPISNSVEILLPFILIQNDNRTNPTLLTAPNKLINKGQVQLEENGVGNYSALYFDWDTTLSYRVGWVFHELRIYVIDDPELATVLTYNANRNFTLPKANTITNSGNDLINPGGGIVLTVNNLETINSNEIVVKTTEIHGFQTGLKVFISNVYVTDINNNLIPSSANGTRYIKLLSPNDPYKFQIFNDQALTTPIISNGTFTTNPLNPIGEVKGTLPQFSYFYTYRLKGNHYTSILPQSVITDFNFAKDGKVDNTSIDAQLTLTWNKMKWLIDSVNQDGFNALSMEFIIGRYKNEDPLNPQIVTGFDQLVVIPISELINTRTLFVSGVQDDFSTNGTALKITKQDYDNFVAKIGGAGTYDPVTNPNGDPTYDIKNNFKHYTYTNGDPVPSDLVVGKGKWTIGNIKYQNEVAKYRATIQIQVPADKWNDTTNPTYDINNPFITDRYISEVAIIIQDDLTLTEKPMIYAKIAPAIKKTMNLDYLLQLNLDF